jgi:recombination protein RecR
MESHNNPSLLKLVNELEKMPGIGPKTAQRLAFYILKSEKNEVTNLTRAIEEAKEKIKYCSVCFNMTEIDPCAICASNKRDRTIICVVEEPMDIVALDKSGTYHGLFHVLMGSISPLDGIGPEDLKIRELLARIKGEKTGEIIVATNPDVEGEATAIYLSKLIKPLGVKVSRLAQGVPMGASLEYADEVTLAKALEGRREI